MSARFSSVTLAAALGQVPGIFGKAQSTSRDVPNVVGDAKSISGDARSTK
jgi:hypothetical protein